MVEAAVVEGLVVEGLGDRSLGHHFLRKRSSRTTSAPPDLSAGWSAPGFRLCLGARRLGACGGGQRARRHAGASRLSFAVLGVRSGVFAGGLGLRLEFGLRRFARRSGIVVAFGGVAGFGERLELQRELDRRVGELRDRGEWNHQPFRNAAERQSDLEQFVGDLHVPELMLEHDGHLFRIAFVQPVGDLYAVRRGVEGDEEMVIAGKPAFGGIGQHVADHAAQGVLDQNVVTDVIDGHGAVKPRIRRPSI